MPFDFSGRYIPYFAQNQPLINCFAIGRKKASVPSLGAG
jgi:hypothetical protein